MTLSPDLKANLIEIIQGLTETQLEGLVEGATLEFITVKTSEKISMKEANGLIVDYKDKVEKSIIFGSGGIRSVRKLLHSNLCEDSEKQVHEDCLKDGKNLGFPSYVIDVEYIRKIIDQTQERVEYLCLYPAFRTENKANIGNYTLVLLGLNGNKNPVLKSKDLNSEENEIYDYIDPCRPCPRIKPPTL